MDFENRTLIAYASKGGATEKTANQIAGILEAEFNLPVDLVNLEKKSAPSIEKYANVVVGSGVRKGAIYAPTLRFLGEGFGRRRLAYFTCSGFIYPKTYEETFALYIRGVLANFPHLKPVATEAFGGYLKILGLPVSRKMDPSRIKLWAEELGKKFTV